MGNGNSLAERSVLHEKGIRSKSFPRVNSMARSLTEEQLALMALVVDYCDAPTDIKVAEYVKLVESVQKLMPCGRVRSKQILSLLAIQVGLQ